MVDLSKKAEEVYKKRDPHTRFIEFHVDSFDQWLCDDNLNFEANKFPRILIRWFFI